MRDDFRWRMHEGASGATAIAAFNVFGYEDAISVIRAAERLQRPVMLSTNPVAVQFMPVRDWGRWLSAMAEAATVPVGIHLDHATDLSVIEMALQSGYTSVMFDGSRLPIEENIRRTREVASSCRSAGAALEGEVGTLGYSGIDEGDTEYTDPDQAAQFVAETGIDWLAVSVGTVQRMRTQDARVDFDRLRAIGEHVPVPLVLHGASGVADQDLTRAAALRVAKVNIGTALRVVFAQTLVEVLRSSPDLVDRYAIFAEPMRAVESKAEVKMRLLHAAVDPVEGGDAQ